MRQNPPCPDCGRPQIQLALFDPDLSLYCEACDAESLGEVDRNYPFGEVSQESSDEGLGTLVGLRLRGGASGES